MQRLLIASLAACAPFAAAAQDDSGRQTGVYLRGAGGAAFGENLNQDLSYNPDVAIAITPASAKATELGDGLALSAAIGFQYANTRTELEYRRMEVSIDGVSYAGGAAPGTPAINDDLLVQALMSNVYFDLVNSSAFTPYVGVGVGGARVENELGERDAAFAYQGRVGVEVALGGKFSLGAEYVYFRTLDVEYGPKDFAPGGPAGPRTDGEPFVSSSVMGTVRVLF
ncbi:MAG: P44/Msp2 family outer membrane protein [Parvularculaceae bacterium]|nr:P44/Msp2 family outer membrane protein [Parvularculaceae bacterium]